jgi:hypothetical protein
MTRRILGLLLGLTLAGTLAQTPSEDFQLFRDEFARDLSAWRVFGGGWVLCTPEPPQAVCANGELGGYIVAGQADWRDYRVETRLTMSKDVGGGTVVARVSEDGQSFYQLELRRWDNGESVWQLQKNRQGIWTTLASAPFDFQLDVAYDLSLQAIGDHLVAAIAEVNSSHTEKTWQQLGVAQDSELRQGYAGIKSLQGGVSFDRVIVTAPPLLNTSEYYVAPYGTDEGPGTSRWPFQTVQHCAQVVQPGESCILRAGVYREEVRPANSGRPGQPITFKSYPGETAVISGADLLTGWTRHEGDIYKTALPWTLGEGNDQVFVDGRMMNEARWPNASLDVSRPTRTTVANAQQRGDSWLLEVSGLPDMQTAYLNLGISNGSYGWVTQTAEARRVSDVQLEVRPVARPFIYPPLSGHSFFLWGARELLDAPGEWFRDDNASLTLWFPDATPPEASRAEAKRRMLAFDLRDRADIHIEGVDVFAATIHTDASSANIVLRGLTVSYPSHFMLITEPWTQSTGDTGVVLHGSNHLLADSLIRLSAGNGVTLHGSGHTVTNNLIHDVNYAATDSAAVTTGCLTCSDLSEGHVISHNTLHTAGRSIIVHRKSQGLSITHNHLYDACLQLDDCGLTYTFDTDGAGTEIAYNVMHGALSNQLGIGIYIDNFSSNFVVHHNIVWDVYDALRLNVPSTNNLVINNTLLATHRSVDYAGDGGMEGVRVINTLANRDIRLLSSAETVANLVTADPGFVNAAANDYRLRPDSPARDAGWTLSPYTDAFLGLAPDIGALEHGSDLLPFGAEP